MTSLLGLRKFLSRSIPWNRWIIPNRRCPLSPLNIENLEDRICLSRYAVDALNQVHLLSTPPAPTTAATAVVFYETSVAGYQALLGSVTAGTDEVLLDAAGDGVRQMAAFLADQHGLTAVHVVAHGSPGAVSLGAASLDSHTIPTYQSELATLGTGLATGGSLDLWSCQVGAGAVGGQFVDDLARATGTGVAAASRYVGSPTLGGSWYLDIHGGFVAAAVPFRSEALAAFDSLLPTGLPTFTGNAVTDFAGLAGVTKAADGLDVGLPPSWPYQYSGWDVNNIYFLYDAIKDDLYVGIDTFGIAGDADGDGDPSRTSTQLQARGGQDNPNLSGSEFFFVTFDVNVDGVNNPTFAAGVGVADAANPSKDISNFDLYTYSTSSPRQLDTLVPGNKVSLYANPSTTQPDLEFVVHGFVATTGANVSAGVEVGCQAGSFQDDGIGEDFIPNAGGTLVISLSRMTPAFSALSGPIISNGSAFVTLSGSITAPGGIPSGNVSITVNGNVQTAPIDPVTGAFSVAFPTATLASGFYPITYSYAGDPVFAVATDASKSLAINPPIIVGPLFATQGTLGQPYTGTLPVGGGSGSYINLVTTGLPTGLSAALSGNTITVSGTPTVGGPFSLGFTLKDSLGATGTTTAPLTISVPVLAAPTSPGGIPTAQPVTPTPSVGNPIFAAGSDAGVLAEVKVYDALTQRLKYDLLPFGAFTGGVRVAVADVTGDGTPDIIAGAGPGGSPQVNIYDGSNGQLLAAFYGLSPRFSGGVFVAASTLSSGQSRLAVSAGLGGGPQVVVYSGNAIAAGIVTGSAPTPLVSFFAFSPAFTGGVTVAVGDVNGDGTPDIIAGAGPGAGPQVIVVDGTRLGLVGTNGQITNSALLASFEAFSPTFTGGVFVSGGATAGSQFNLIIGAGSGGSPQVVVVDGSKLGMVGTNGQIINAAVLDSFYAFAPTFTGGVRVGFSASFVSRDRQAILTAAGRTGGPQVAPFDAGTLRPLGNFFAMPPDFTGGLFIAG